MTRPCLFRVTEALGTSLREEAERGLAAVRNSHLLKDLRAVVQVRAVPMEWSTVAAFDLAVVADEYAQQCREQTSLGSCVEYRVVRL